MPGSPAPIAAQLTTSTSSQAFKPLARTAHRPGTKRLQATPQLVCAPAAPTTHLPTIMQKPVQAWPAGRDCNSDHGVQVADRWLQAYRTSVSNDVHDGDEGAMHCSAVTQQVCKCYRIMPSAIELVSLRQGPLGDVRISSIEGCGVIPQRPRCCVPHACYMISRPLAAHMPCTTVRCHTARDRNTSGRMMISQYPVSTHGKPKAHRHVQ